MLPWSLLVLSLVVGLSGVVLEKQRYDGAELRASSALTNEQKARAELTSVTAANQALDIRVKELQSEVGRLNVKVAAVRTPPMRHEKARRKHGKARHHRR